MTRIDRLIAAMTLDEKIGQLTMVSAGPVVTGPVVAEDATDDVRSGRIGSVLNLVGRAAVDRLQRVAVSDSRLGIPLLFGFDAIHGHRTIFPIPLAETAAFDPDLWERTAAAAAAEAAADGIALTFAPMLDVARDPRWGRIAEGPGEDPLVASVFAVAKVQGFQGHDPAEPGKVGATAKHFVAYGAALAGRDYASADLSERTLHEVYLPPFAAAVAAGVVAIMPSFQDLAGVPMTANTRLLHGWLREETGFAGLIVSDYHAIAELMNHGIAGDLVEAAALALNAGVDIDMMGDAYRRGLPGALDHGLVTVGQVDAAVRRVLATKERLGLFDHPYARSGGADDATHRQEPAREAAHRRDLAREAGRGSIVLLRNDGTLPIAASVGRLAVVGPLADTPAQMLGPWAGHGDPTMPVGILDGLRAALPDAEIGHAKGVAIDGGDARGILPALELCRAADLIVLCVGEAADMSGEAACRAILGLPGRQTEFATAVLDQGRPVILVLSSGRPLTIQGLIDRANATLATWFLGDQAGHAIADIVTGRVSPSGRLPVSWPRGVGQIPIFFGQRPTGRPAAQNDHYTSKYLDLPTTPLFPFGHGLSYGTFVHADLEVMPRRFAATDTIRVGLEVANRGKVRATETVFLFTRDLVAEIARPLMELQAFAKIDLEPGASGRVAFHLEPAALGYLDKDLQPRLEPGDFEVMVGPSADRARLLSTTITLVQG